MADLGPLTERLSKVENGIEHSESSGSEGLALHGESLGRVLEKVVRALEARLTEHVGHVDRQLAEMDAKTALDLNALENATVSQNTAFEKAFQQVEGEMRGYVEAAHQHNSEQIASVDQRLSALQEALPAKFREIVEAVRQSLEARLALELKQLEERARAIAPEQVRDLESKMRAEIEALAAKMAGDLQQVAEQQQSQAAPLHDGLRQLEGKLDTLRDELPPKIRQIVETVDAAMNARIAKVDSRSADQVAQLEAKIGGLRQELAADSRTPALEQNVGRLQEALAAMDTRQQGSERQVTETVASLRRALDDDLQRHAGQVSAVSEKLTQLQAELPPKFKAIVDAVHESMNARMSAQLKDLEEQARVRSERDADGVRRAMEASVAGEIRAAMDRELPAKLKAMVDAEMQGVEARAAGRAADAEKVTQYVSLLEARIQSLEQQLHAHFEATVERAVERVWQSLESRLQQRAARAPAPESVTALRQKSTSAERSVIDLIAGLGNLFENPAQPTPVVAPPEPPAVHRAENEGMPPPVVKMAPAPERVLAVLEKPAPPPVVPPAAPAAKEEPAMAAPAAAAEVQPEEPAQEEAADEKPPVILFKPKEAGRKWRIPFVSSFFLMGLAILWLQFM